ncbi:MAG: hypothetical protein A2Y62_03670 [Candidatus Fischerbacteria bacterium RBG_13_37_8]|uniref:Bulb-type lectin domain-containing protein n=1 Tax=Candidatus Fischerbacteria bacterium RBG_13_37_8 TaxID=1817863 RepID=A0A1F5V9H0_9BACT|nr:MAG: hypothetical protein A2Y62_03670 [Candidatus Fischerbacteria bacterium RBG_13_37_8]
MYKIKISLRLLLGILLLIGFVTVVKAQEYWAKTYGLSSSEYSYVIQQTTDGGYIMTGPTTAHFGGYDFWVLKADAAGNVMWDKVFGGTLDDIPNALKQTTDGGYIIAGRTQSFSAGGFDYWVIKLDPAGNAVWQRNYGGTSDDLAYGIQQTTDGGYIVAGTSLSYTAGGYDVWILKLDSAGGVTWQRRYGGNGTEWPYAIINTSDGGYAVAGYESSYSPGGNDIWVLKLTSDGSISWQRAYGGTSAELALGINQTTDGGYIVAGRTESYGAGSVDFYVLRLDSLGNLVWNKALGGSSTDWAFSTVQTPDGGFVVVGRTDSFGAGNADYWVVKFDSAGAIKWQKTFGGTSLDYAYSVQMANDGSILVGGVCGSFGVGGYDVLFLKLNPETGEVGNVCSMMSTTTVTPVTPSPNSQTTTSANTTVNGASGIPQPSEQVTASSVMTYCYYSGGLPGEVLNNLLVSKVSGNPMLSWLAPGGTCSVTAYGIYRGTLPISAYNHASQSCSVTGLNYTDAGATSSYYYLVVPLTATAEGSYGTSYDGTTWTERPIGSSPCHTQDLTACN